MGTQRSFRKEGNATIASSRGFLVHEEHILGTVLFFGFDSKSERLCGIFAKVLWCTEFLGSWESFGRLLSHRPSFLGTKGKCDAMKKVQNCRLFAPLLPHPFMHRPDGDHGTGSEPHHFL